MCIRDRFGVHLHQPVGFMSVRHGFQVWLDVLHADTFLLHIRQVYLRDVQRLELPLLLRLKPFGGVDTVIFQNLRVEVDADKMCIRDSSKMSALRALPSM